MLWRVLLLVLIHWSLQPAASRRGGGGRESGSGGLGREGRRSGEEQSVTVEDKRGDLLLSKTEDENEKMGLWC